MPSQRNRPLQGRAIPFHRHPTTSEGIPAALRRKAAASAPLENEQPEPFIPSSGRAGPRVVSYGGFKAMGRIARPIRAKYARSVDLLIARELLKLRPSTYLTPEMTSDQK